MNNTQEKPNKGCAIALIIGLIVFVCWLISPSKKDETQKVIDEKDLVLEKTKTEAENNTENKDYSSFQYLFPNSNYVFDVKIKDMKTEIKKNEFELRSDEYSVAKKVDGYILSMVLEFSNPYEKEIMAPIPNYYAITSLDKEYFSSSTTYSRSSGCDINNTTEIKDKKGKDLWNISEGRCGAGDYCIRFKAKEKKEFILTFTDPIIITQKKIVFIAFDKTYKEEGNTRDRDIGFIFDTETRKITGMKYL